MKKKICHTTLHGVKPSEQGVPEISALSSTSPPGGGHLFQEQPHSSLLPYTCTLHLCKKSPLDHHLCPSFLFITASHCTTINKYLENFNACNPNVCIISWTKRLQTIPYSKLGKVGTTRSHQDKLNCFSISIKSPTTKCILNVTPWQSILHVPSQLAMDKSFNVRTMFSQAQTIYQKNYHHPQMVFLMIFFQGLIRVC